MTVGAWWQAVLESGLEKLELGLGSRLQEWLAQLGWGWRMLSERTLEMGA